MCNFWTQNGLFPQIRIFFRKAVHKPCFFHSCLSACQKSNSDTNRLVTIKEYWNLIGWEPFLDITWVSHFSQACSFCRMLMSHKNFHFTQIPDKTNGVIFLKSPKNMFLGHFWPFLVIYAWWRFFPKNPALSHITIYGPLTLC